MRHTATIALLLLTTLTATAQRTYWQHLLHQWPSLTATTLAGAADGTGDVLQFWYSSSRFPQSGPARQFWDPELSWRNKWRTGPDGTLQQPLQEKFWGSSRWFVSTTDAWHITKSVKLAAIHSAIVMYRPEPRTYISWTTGHATPTRARWWWKPADFIAHRLAFWVGWQSSVSILKN